MYYVLQGKRKQFLLQKKIKEWKMYFRLISNDIYQP